MAGLGFKDFQVGEVLTSADVDGYLMQQSVMRFADSGARGSALGTAVGTGVALAEGMVTYLDDVNQVQVFDGSIWKPTGSIVQVVQAVKTDHFTTTSNAYVDITGLSVSITPSSSTSKVLVLYNVTVSNSSSAQASIVQLVRDSTNVYLGTGGTGRNSTVEHKSATDVMRAYAGQYLDSPATTSSTTYKLQVQTTGAGTAMVNRRGDTDSVGVPSSITVMEVAA